VPFLKCNIGIPIKYELYINLSGFESDELGRVKLPTSTMGRAIDATSKKLVFDFTPGIFKGQLPQTDAETIMVTELTRIKERLNISAQKNESGYTGTTQIENEELPTACSWIEKPLNKR
jgi:hypothetical protein